MKSVYTTDEVLQHICKWFVNYYRKYPDRNFYQTFLDDQWSWAQHVNSYTPDYSYMIITAGTVVYSLSIHTDEFKFFTEGKTYDK